MWDDSFEGSKSSRLRVVGSWVENCEFEMSFSWLVWHSWKEGYYDDDEIKQLILCLLSVLLVTTFSYKLQNFVIE